jgi:hypothetical protein
MRRIKLFEDYSGNKEPRYTEDEVSDAFKMCDFKGMVDVDLVNTEFDVDTKSIETADPKSDPGFKRINFEFYISDSKFKIEVDRIKKEVKRNLLNVKSDNPDDEDLLQDLASIGMKEKTYSFSEIMDNLGDEKFMSDFCIVDDSDYFFQTEIEEGIRNPAEVWTKITSYGGEVKFDNMLFMDYVLDKIDTKSKK